MVSAFWVGLGRAAASPRPASGAGQTPKVLHLSRFIRVVVMFDFLMIAYGAGFFGAAILYVVACEKM
jgi:hypothetical protein